MRAVGIRAFKDKLSEYVRAASAGEIVLVTDRDRVVAELGPPSAGRARTADDARIAELVQRGILTPPRMRRSEPPPNIPTLPLAELLEGLEEDRAERAGR